MFKRLRLTLKRLTMQFIKENRSKIDSCINKHSPGVFGRLNDEVRRQWLSKIVPEKNCHKNISCENICWWYSKLRIIYRKDKGVFREN